MVRFVQLDFLPTKNRKIQPDIFLTLAISITLAVADPGMTASNIQICQNVTAFGTGISFNRVGSLQLEILDRPM